MHLTASFAPVNISSFIGRWAEGSHFFVRLVCCSFFPRVPIAAARQASLLTLMLSFMIRRRPKIETDARLEGPLEITRLPRAPWRGQTA